MHVLVIDDEPVILRATRRLLRGHDVVTVERGAEALERLDAGETFDVLLCDMTMPGMTGADVVYATGPAGAPSTAHARRTIFVTGGAITPETEEFLANVDRPRLDKPFPAAALMALMTKVAKGDR